MFCKIHMEKRTQKESRNIAQVHLILDEKCVCVASIK